MTGPRVISEEQRLRKNARTRELYWEDIAKSRDYNNEKSRRLYAARREYRKIRNREYMRANAFKYAARAREERLLRAYVYLIRKAKHRAKAAGLACDLTVEWATNVWTGRCALSGLPFETGTGKSCVYSASIDRIDPKLGYTQSNCRFILLAFNRFKGELTDELMFELATVLVARGKP